MRRIELHGGSYIDALPDGRYAGIRGHVIETSAGDIPLDGGASPGFLRLNPVAAGIHFGGQGSNFHGVLEWDGHWRRDLSLVPTPYGVIYGPDGTRHVWTGGPHLSSQGYRYVRADGIPVFSDDTLLLDGVSEWTDLSDAQDGSILVGQGHHGGGVVVRIDGVLRLLDDGPCFHINARRQGQQCSIAYVKLGVGGVACWPTLAELRALPPVAVAPQPPLPPIPQPPTPPEPPPMPDIEALTQLVRTAVEAVHLQHPRLLRDNTKESCGEFTERVVLKLASVDANFGHVGKQPGQTNYRLHAVDAVMYKSPKQVWDIIGSAENHPHPGQPAANPVAHGDQPWMAPIPVAGEPTPPPPTPPPPASDVQAQLDELRGAVASLAGSVVNHGKRLKAIEDAPEIEPQPPIDLSKLRVRGKTSKAGGGWWGPSHQHDVDLEVVQE